MLYVVSVLHQTGHGPVDTPVMITANFSRALRVTMEIEELGYEFIDETGVTIYRLETEKSYPKNLFSLSGDEMPAENFPIVFGRMKLGDAWKDTWYDEKFKHKYSERVPA